MIQFSKYIGDNITLTIPLELDGEALSPGSDYTLIFTAKRSVSDSDSEAIFQKASGAGITVSGTNAIVALVPNDTEGLANCSLTIGIKAQHVTTEVVKTVSQDRLILSLPATRGNQTSVPVSTTSTALPFARTATEIHAATEKTTPVDADEFGIADSADSYGIKKTLWSSIKATLKTYFDTLYPSGSGTSSGTNTGDQDLSAYVTLTGSQALTNKTINGNTITSGTGTISLGVRGAIYMTDGSGSPSYGGGISTAGGDGANAHGGSISTYGGNSSGANGGFIDTSGGTLPGGSILMSNGGGSINTSTSGGSINTSGSGGAINTSGSGGAINTTAGGSFTTGTGNLTGPATDGTIALTSNKLSAFAATTSSELAGVVSDETGTGALVFANSPTLTTPVISGQLQLDAAQAATDENSAMSRGLADARSLVSAQGSNLTINNSDTYNATSMTLTLTAGTWELGGFFQTLNAATGGAKIYISVVSGASPESYQHRFFMMSVNGGSTNPLFTSGVPTYGAGTFPFRFTAAVGSGAGSFIALQPTIIVLTATAQFDIGFSQNTAVVGDATLYSFSKFWARRLTH